MPPIPPILALDSQTVVIIAIVIAILNTLVQAIKGKQEQAPPLGRPNADRGRLEIESFLEEISGVRPARPESPKRPPPKAKTPQRTSGGKPAKKPGKSASSPKTAAPQVTDTVSAPLSETHLASSNFGSGIGSHISSSLQPDHLAAEVRQDMKSRIAEEVDADLGRTSFLSTPAATPVHPLVRLLRDPRSIRQVMALHEILQKPKSLRRNG